MSDIKFVNYKSVIVKPEWNLGRFHSGDTFAGHVVGDSYDIPAMAEAIVEAGKVLTPLEVYNVRLQDGTIVENVVGKGNRRHGGISYLDSNRDKFPSVQDWDAIVNIPIVPKGTVSYAEFIRETNDQTSKAFSTSGVIRWAWEMFESGYTVLEIGIFLWALLANWPTSKMRTAWQRVNALPEGPEKNKERKKALTGLVHDEILAVAKMTERVKAAYLHDYLIKDGLIDPHSKPEFKCSRERIAKLRKHIEEDKKMESGWNPIDGGTLYNSQIEAWIVEDAKPKTTGNKGDDSPKLPAVKELADSLKSGIGNAIKTYLTTGNVQDVKRHDNAVLNLELCCKRLNASLDKLNKLKKESLLAVIHAMLAGNFAEIEKIVAE